jgi:hypothetical protein
MTVNCVNALRSRIAYSDKSGLKYYSDAEKELLQLYDTAVKERDAAIKERDELQAELAIVKEQRYETWLRRNRDALAAERDELRKRVEALEGAAREYLMRSVPDPNTGVASEDALRSALEIGK